MVWDPSVRNITGYPWGTEGNSLSNRSPVEKVIESFEALFVAQFVRGLREAFSEELGKGDGFGKGVYMAWFDQAMAEAISKAGGLGIQKQLARWVRPEEATSIATEGTRYESRTSDRGRKDPKVFRVGTDTRRGKEE